MNDIELINICQEQLKTNDFVALNDDIFYQITQEQGHLLNNYFGKKFFLKLPKREIVFFNWLKNNDIDIWNDLWEDSIYEPYIISFSFLPILLDKNRGYPICDLMKNDNYFFTIDHLVDNERIELISSIIERYTNREPLTIAQMLLLEISIAPIDIWHFAYKHGYTIENSKKAVLELIEEKLLLHIKNTDELVDYIQF